MKIFTQACLPFHKKIIKTNNINNKFIKWIYIFVAFLLLSNNFLQAQIGAPRPDFRRSDWINALPDGTPIARNESGEDWWYGHCNAYKGNEFVGYICVGFSRPKSYFPPVLPGDCVDPEEVEASDTTVCRGTSYAAIGLIDKSGDFRHMFKIINNAFEDLYSVIQTSDGNFVAVGGVSGTRDENGYPMTYNPRVGEPTISFPNNFICEEDVNGNKNQLN